ncbi:MAG: ABC transporter permease [Peptococcaceae bacterium]|nr:ABC transporter permease [Peptococcaceae bacterium]
MKNIAQRIIKQIAGDKRSLAMMLIVPLLLLTLIYLLLAKSTYIPTVALENLPSPLAAALEEHPDRIDLVTKDASEDIEEYLKDRRADAVITMKDGALHLIMMEPDSVKASVINDTLKSAVEKLNPERQMSLEFVYGEMDQSLFDSMGFLLLGILAFFLIFLFAGISFVRERTSDTLERLMLTPIKTVSVVGGYVLGFSVFALLQSILMILYAKFVLRMPFVGELWLAALIMMMLAMVAVVTGVLISALSKNEFQVVQFVPLIIIPQIFFSGLIPVDTLPYHLDYFSKIMPLYYGTLGLKGVLVYGYGFMEVLPQIGVLFGFIAVLFAANIFAVKKYRAI